MKKKIIIFTSCLLLMTILLTGCSENERARAWGGSMTIELEPGQKLEMITWKDNELWYLTRPMWEDEEPETHTFQEESEYGIIEGKVIIKERK